MTNERPENVWAATLPNGLHVRVLCKPDFQRSYAVLAACYGGADRRFRVDDTWTDTPASRTILSTNSSTCPTARTR